MGFLYLLESIRMPALDAVMSAVTRLGDETFFMVIAILLFWCVSKRQGYYVFAVGLAGTAANQWLKLAFRVPRPWVLDPQFTIVESARAAAAGYSFPSGHTQNIVGTLGCVAVSNRQKWLRAVCVVLILLVPFSRMYLGVHTPLDVGVAFGMALALVAALRPAFRDDRSFRAWTPRLLAALTVLTVCLIAYVALYPFPADIDAANLASGTKNAWTLLGCAAGLGLSFWYDAKVLHFDERAPLPGQICKLVLGLALLLAIRAGLKPLLAAALHGHAAANALRYFAMVAFAGCVWPHTFPLFARLGAKKN